MGSRKQAPRGARSLSPSMGVASDNNERVGRSLSRGRQDRNERDQRSSSRTGDDDEADRLSREKRQLEERNKEITERLETIHRQKIEELEHRYQQEKIAIDAAYAADKRLDKPFLPDIHSTEPAVTPPGGRPAPQRPGASANSMDSHAVQRIKYEAIKSYPGDFKTFSAWKSSAEFTLMRNGLFGYILDERNPIHPVAEDVNIFRRDSLYTYEFLREALTWECFQYVRNDNNNPAELWKSLCNYYDQLDESKFSTIFAEMSNMTWGWNSDLEEHAAEFCRKLEIVQRYLSHRKEALLADHLIQATFLRTLGVDHPRSPFHQLFNARPPMSENFHRLREDIQKYFIRTVKPQQRRGRGEDFHVHAASTRSVFDRLEKPGSKRIGPSAEHPCRACGGTDHWANQHDLCPKKKFVWNTRGQRTGRDRPEDREPPPRDDQGGVNYIGDVGHVRLMHIGDRPLDKDLQDFLLQDDTGADGVFVRDLDLLQDYSPLPKPITVGIAKEEASFEILGIGSLSLLDDNGRIVTFFRVYFAPDCAGNFLGAIPLHSTGWRDRGTLGQRVWEHPAGYQITFRQRAGGYFRAIKPVSIGGRAGLHVRRFCDTEPAPSGGHFARSPASTAGTSGRVAHGGTARHGVRYS